MISDIKVDIKNVESSRITPIKEPFKKRIIVSNATVVGNSEESSVEKIFVSYQSERKLYGCIDDRYSYCPLPFTHFDKMNYLPVPVDLPGIKGSSYKFHLY